MEITLLVDKKEIEAFRKECKRFHAFILNETELKTVIDVKLTVPVPQTIYSIGLVLGFERAEKAIKNGI